MSADSLKVNMSLSNAIFEPACLTRLLTERFMLPWRKLALVTPSGILSTMISALGDRPTRAP